MWIGSYLLLVSKELDYIVTRNIKDYQEGPVKVILPDDLISMLEEEE